MYVCIHIHIHIYIYMHICIYMYLYIKRVLDVSHAQQWQPVCVPGKAPVLEHGHLHNDPHSGTLLSRARDDATRHPEGGSV